MEFAVSNVEEIAWSNSPLDELRIAGDRKAMIKALTDSHLSRGSMDSFDDIVKGKGRGLNLLL